MKRKLITKTITNMKKCAILLSLAICLSFLDSCQDSELSIHDENNNQQTEYAEINSEKQDDSEAENIKNIEAAGNAEINDKTESEPVAPTKEEVLSMRELVLEGMSEEEISRLTENIKIANLRMERAYLYENIFAELEDPESLYWNYFDYKGEIQISETKTVNNRFHAENFINLLEEMKATVQNEALRNDLQQIIDQTALAAETHKMEYANNIYRLLHDMDYFLLRYGPEDVGKYTKDKSIVSKYCGVLSVYD